MTFLTAENTLTLLYSKVSIVSINPIMMIKMTCYCQISFLETSSSKNKDISLTEELLVIFHHFEQKLEARGLL